jgi:hypothetical protein
MGVLSDAKNQPKKIFLFFLCKTIDKRKKMSIIVNDGDKNNAKSKK